MSQCIRASSLAMVALALLGAQTAAARPAASAAGAWRCDVGDVCVYEHANWDDSGWTFLWRVHHGEQRFRGDVRNNVSSWSNPTRTANGGRKWCVYDDLTARPDKLLWVMNPGTWSRTVPSGANDRADYAKPC